MDNSQDSEKRVTITVTSLENIRVKDFPINIGIDIKYGAECLTTASSILVEKENVAVDLKASLSINVNEFEQLNKLVGTPITFDIFEETVRERKSAKSGKLNFGGRCYLDLLPLVIGETILGDQPLTVEVSAYHIGQQMVPWTHLPLLHVMAKVDEPLISKETLQESNILFFTLESIYNIPPSMPENFTFKAGIEVPINETNEEIYFSNGMVYVIKDTENWKHWNGIPFQPGRNALTKQRISEDHHEIRNYTGQKINFKTLLKSDIPHVRWNTLQRLFMNKEGMQEFKGVLLRNNYMPIEFLVEALDEKVYDKSKNKKSKEAEPTAVLHLISLLDLSPLLYPGVRRIRLASSITNFNELEHTESSHTGKTLFNVVIEAHDQPSPDVSEKEKSKSKKAQTKIEKPSFDPQTVVEEHLFVIVEVELLHPLIPEAPLDHLQERIKMMIPERRELIKTVKSGKDIKDEFRDCIKILNGKLHYEYHNYINHLKQFPSDKDIKPFATGRDILPDFMDYLTWTGDDLLIEETLKKQIINICRLRLRRKIKRGTMLDIMREIQDIFIFMVTEMHQTLNSHIEGQPNVPSSTKEYVNSEMMAYFAFEALEEEKYDEGKKWLLRGLNLCDTDCDAWLDLALYYVRVEEIDEATICLQKVIALQRKNFLGLLLYAILMTEKQCYSEAKIFFQTLACLYGDYREVWAALNVFFILTEDKVGQEESMRRATRSKLTAIHWPIKQYLLMSWRDMKEIASPYLEAASLFLKLNSLKFAEMALAQELAQTQNVESTCYIYYSAVLSFLKGDFQDAISLLEKITPECQAYPPWCLAGQASFKLGMAKKAYDNLRFAIHCLHPPPDYHMLYLRMGELYYNEGQYDQATEMFINTCQYYGSPHSWRLAGQAALENGNYQAAELCLGESNILDKCDPNTWALLALVSLSLRQKDTFQICYKQALMLNFDDEQMEAKICKMQEEVFPEDSD